MRGGPGAGSAVRLCLVAEPQVSSGQLAMRGEIPGPMPRSRQRHARRSPGVCGEGRREGDRSGNGRGPAGVREITGTRRINFCVTWVP